MGEASRHVQMKLCTYTRGAMSGVCCRTGHRAECARRRDGLKTPSTPMCTSAGNRGRQRARAISSTHILPMTTHASHTPAICARHPCGRKAPKCFIETLRCARSPQYRRSMRSKERPSSRGCARDRCFIGDRPPSWCVTRAHDGEAGTLHDASYYASSLMAG